MANRLHIRGAQVVTMDETLGDFVIADILVEEGAILAVGRALDAAGAETIDAAGMIALPGIIDAHTCLWQTVLRGYVPDVWAGLFGPAKMPKEITHEPHNAVVIDIFGPPEAARRVPILSENARRPAARNTQHMKGAQGDPILGVTMDQSRTRFGRYRPWLTASAPVLSGSKSAD